MTIIVICAINKCKLLHMDIKETDVMLVFSIRLFKTAATYSYLIFFNSGKCRCVQALCYCNNVRGTGTEAENLSINTAAK